MTSHEFAYQGEVTTRPTGKPTQRELSEYVYFRDNVAGVQREWWYHRVGCGLWFLAERDTRTNEVLARRDPGNPAASRNEARAAARASVIDRAATVTFTFDGKPVTGFAGDTIGSALYAAGRRVFSRSFKYHRPRGLLCCSGHCANCMMTVDGVPNVRVCVEPAVEGAVVRAQNVLGSLDRDLLSVVDRRRWAVHAGRLLLPDDDPAAASMAAVREVSAERRRSRPRADRRHSSAATTPSTVRVDVLVIGGGRSGRRAAAEAASGRQASRARRRARRLRGGGLRGARAGAAIGIYEGGLVPVDAGNRALPGSSEARSSSPPARSSSRSSSPETTSSA